MTASLFPLRLEIGTSLKHDPFSVPGSLKTHTLTLTTPSSVWL